MISLPARSLYLVCDSVASKFFTAGRVTYMRGGASADRVGSGIRLPLPLSMGSRWVRNHVPAPIELPYIRLGSVAFAFSRFERSTHKCESGGILGYLAVGGARV